MRWKRLDRVYELGPEIRFQDVAACASTQHLCDEHLVVVYVENWTSVLGKRSRIRRVASAPLIRGIELVKDGKIGFGLKGLADGNFTVAGHAASYVRPPRKAQNRGRLQSSPRARREDAARLARALC